MKIAVIYGSTRENGNTAALAQHAVKGLDVTHIDLKDYEIKVIEDGRHDELGFQDRTDDYNDVMEMMMAHDLIIFATPIYWYSMSSLMKTFIDRWSQTMRETEYTWFREALGKKQAYVIAVGGDEPYTKGLPMIQQFQHIFDFFGTTFSGYIIGEANRPHKIARDERAWHAAEVLRENLKEQIKA